MNKKTLFKMPKISIHPNGKYWARVQTGTNANGEPKRKALYGDSKKEVKEKVLAFMEEIIIQRRTLDNNKDTLSVWMYLATRQELR